MLEKNNFVKKKKLKKLLILAVFAAAVEQQQEQPEIQEKRQRRWWTREWILRREFQLRGSIHLALNELAHEDIESFHRFFRMDYQLFNNLLDKVSPFIQRQDTVMRKSIPPIQRLSLTLRYLATGESYRSMEFTTRVPACTLSRIIPETVRVIYEVLKDEYLKIPDNEEEWNHVADNYLRQWNVPNCIGAMDGRHIEFKVPLSQGSLYHNYKGTNSIVLLALVNAHYQFIYVNVGVNGRVSDGGVFRESDLTKYINDPQNPLNMPKDKPLPNMNHFVPFVILADAAFPLQNHILKPYPSRNLSHDERIFNYRLSRGRRVVENVFGILANRFRVLLTQIYLSVESVQNITLACCALHNFISKENDAYLHGAVDIEDLENQTIIPATWRNNNAQLRNLEIVNVRPNRNAIYIRDVFKEYFNTVGRVEWQEAMI